MPNTPAAMARGDIKLAISSTKLGNNFVTSGNWSGPVNWSTGVLPATTETVHISANANVDAVETVQSITIYSGGVLTIPSGKALTVNGALTNNAGNTGLVIKSTDSGTGSLKVLGSVSGSATVQQWVAPDAWHLISSPVATEPVIDFLNDNKDIAIASNTKDSPSYTFAMRDYNLAGTGWTDYFTGAKPNTDLFGTGKGYLVLTRIPVVVPLEFKGDLNTLPVNTVAVKTGWNLVGNPFTSAISINAAAGTASGGTNFIDTNTAALTGSYAAIYVWDETAIPKEYQVVNHTYNGSAAFYAQVG